MVVLPTGVVTFLFTDIEGSTALWQRYPDAMPRVIARHDALLKEIIGAHGGVVFRTVGDAVHAAFVTPGDAVAAALAAQRALIAERWPQGVAIRVRMGIHTGVVEIQGGEYAGHTLNRVARVTAAGHGGQILLSAATAELVRHAQPSGVTFRDMGEHRLKDLLLPERIYMIEAPDLAAEFPSLRTLDVPRTNLPVRRGGLVGRENELETAKALLMRDDVGLVTFTGAGGTGKTSLALAAGRELLDRFPDGVWFVSLAPITDPGLVPSAIMASLGLREEGGRSPMEMLHEFLGPKRTLLILDNLEQVVAAAPLIAELLAGASGLTVLVTSRIALHLREEHDLPIAPLSLPDRDHLHLPSLSQYAAVQLFITRAQEVKPSFTVTNENAPAVAEICARLDGLPLAIELAAARIRVLTPQALLGRLERRLPLLTGGAHDLPERQRTMETAIAWSYDLLTEDEQTLYRRLSVFAGGFTLEQAEAVCSLDGEGLDLLDGITSMVDKNLIRQEDIAGESRFSMLQTIREYGLARLQECGEAEAIHLRHAAVFAGLAETLDREGYDRGVSVAYGKTEAEWNNFRAALDWSLGDPGDTEIALRLMGALGSFFLFGEYASEGRARVAALLARPDGPKYGESWANALIVVGILDLQQGKGEAMAYLTRSEELLRESSNHLLLGKIANWLAIPALNRGDTQTAERLFAEGRDHSRAAGLRWAETTAVSYIAETLVMQGKLDEGHSMAKEALRGYRALRDAWGIGRMQVMLAAMAWLSGEYATAHTFGAEAVSLLRQAGEPYNVSRALTLMGIILVDEGEYKEAENVLAESLFNWRKIGNRGGMVLALAGLTAAVAGQGRTEQARRLYAAEPFHGAQDSLLLDRLMEAGFERFMRCIQDRLGDQPRGDTPALSLEEAVDYALETAAGNPVTPLG